VLAVLLSCHLIWLRSSGSIRHRHFSSIAVIGTLFDARLRQSAKLRFRSDTPCNLPCSSRAVSHCIEAVPWPARHMSLSELRGSITGNRARSDACRRRQDIVLPVFLVCIIPSAARADLRVLSSRQPAAVGVFVIMSARSSAAAAWPHWQR
jgi:hypothetical protein